MTHYLPVTEFAVSLLFVLPLFVDDDDGVAVGVRV